MPHPLADPLRSVHTGPNWTDVNLRDLLVDLTWREATRTLGPHHPIATLVHHIRYFVAGVAPVLEGGALDIRDAFSFDAPAFGLYCNTNALTMAAASPRGRPGRCCASPPGRASPTSRPSRCRKTRRAGASSPG